MNTQADRVLALLKARGLKDREIRSALARTCGIAYQSVKDWFTGDTKKIGSEHLMKIAREWRGRVEWLIDGSGAMDANSSESVKPAESPTNLVWDSGRPLTTRAATRLPVISWEGAGKMLDAENPYSVEDAKDWKDSPFPAGENAFLLIVEGESMCSPDGLGFRHGEMIHVEPAVRPAHGADVVARLPNGKVTFRRYKESPDGAYLEAINPAWPERIIKIQYDMAIIGVVVASWVDRRKS